MRANNSLAVMALCMGAVLGPAHLAANQRPVASAGVDRYLGDQPVTLDAGGSYDPDPGDTLVSYTWNQVSGPPVSIDDAHAPTPTITAYPVPDTVGIVVLRLVVSDGQLDSLPDTIQLTVVPAIPAAIQLFHQNPPFDPAKPTQVFFDGGNCISGGGNYDEGPLWHATANVITFVYDRPYPRCGDALIAFLSRVAPNYTKPIQTCGFSTGAMPALESALRLNKVYRDPRYAVTIVNLLDAGCNSSYSYDPVILDFLNNPVGGNAPWVQNFYSVGRFRPRCVNVIMQGDHSLPALYYLWSVDPSFFSTDVYNHGMVAGVYTSVLQHGANYRMPILANSPYYFRAVFEPAGTVHLEQVNATNYPGRLPQPIELLGPPDGAVVPADAAVGLPAGAACTTSENSIAYDLLMGPGPDQLSVTYTSAAPPSLTPGLLPPGITFYWTVQARDAYGTIYRANVRSLTTEPGLKVDINNDGGIDAGDCAVIQGAFGTTWGDPGFHLAADYDGSGTIDYFDYTAWLADYRAAYGDPGRPDPCGLTLTPDADADGIVDSWDTCPDTVPGSPVDVHGCPPHIPGDIEGDGDVELSEFGHLQACLGMPATGDCADIDMNRSTTIDYADVILFLRCMRGTNVPVDPNCAN